MHFDDLRNLLQRTGNISDQHVIAAAIFYRDVDFVADVASEASNDFA
jgi:hypothetical protein